MRTTVRLDKALREQAREEAKRRGTTLTALIEEGLRWVLRRPLQRAGGKTVRLPTSPSSGGTAPGVDLDRSTDVLDQMEGRR